MNRRSVRSCLCAALVSALGPQPAAAETRALDREGSPDIVISLGSQLVTDHELARMAAGASATPVTYPGIPVGADVVAHALLPGGDVLIALDTHAELPADPSPLFVRPGDVVRLSGGLYALEFDADAQGLPAGVEVDAVAWASTGLLLSFDGPVALGGVFAADEDLVNFDAGVFSLAFDGSSAGVDAALDLDAGHYIESVDRYRLSFDTSGSVGGVAFADEDVLEFDPAGGAWELATDLTQLDPAWRAADLDALTVRADPDQDGSWDGDEQARGTDPLDADSDDDGLLDGVETDTGIFLGASDTGTDPLDQDTDDDGFGDGTEVAGGADPTDPGSFPAVASVPALSPAARLLLALSLPGSALAWRRFGPRRRR